MPGLQHSLDLPLSIRTRCTTRDTRVAKLESLAHEHFRTLWRVAQRMGLDAAEAEDVVLRTLDIAARRLDEIVGGKERAFLVQTTINMTRKILHARRHKPIDLVDDFSAVVDDTASIEERLDQRRALELLDHMLGRLSLKLREPLILFEIEGYSKPEIAQILGLPLGTVSSRLRRGRERFLRIAAEHKLTPEGMS